MKRILPLAFAATLPLYAQHDPGRDAVRILAKGDVEGTLKAVEKKAGKMNSPIDEAEIAFVRAMAACQQGKPEEAFTHAKDAVSKGLQISRLQAGPREVLKPLHNYRPFRNWMVLKSHNRDGLLGNPAASSNPSAAAVDDILQRRLVHGPMVGAATDTSASIWFRTAGEAEMQVWFRPLGNGEEWMKAKAKTSAERDYTAVIRLEGLKPETEYEYQLQNFSPSDAARGGIDFTGPLINWSVDGVTLEDLRFKTFPKQGAPSKFRVAFGGGAGYTPQFEHMWTTIAERKPLSLMLLGDNIYIDDAEHSLTQNYCYYRRQSNPLWRKLVASTNVAAIYDDHDFSDNDCVPGPKIDEPAWKLPVWRLFRNNWVNPSYGGGDKQPGCWFDFTIGQVHFIELDCRFYRDLEGGSMLGPVQKAWLMDTLKNSKGVFKVLVSSVPWSPGVKPGSKDTWDGFPAEREEIFSAIEKNQISGVLLMSADRHRTDYRKIPRPNGYDLYDMMSSRLTNVHTHPLTQNAKGSEFIMGYNEKCSFGQLDFDTTAEDPTVTFTIVNLDNEEKGKATLKLSELR